MGCHARRKRILLRIRSAVSPPCPRDLYGSQNDKHSDFRAKGSVTAMAVVADLHRISLSPSIPVTQDARQASTLWLTAWTVFILLCQKNCNTSMRICQAPIRFFSHPFPRFPIPTRWQYDSMGGCAIPCQFVPFRAMCFMFFSFLGFSFLRFGFFGGIRAHARE